MNDRYREPTEEDINRCMDRAKVLAKQLRDEGLDEADQMTVLVTVLAVLMAQGAEDGDHLLAGLHMVCHHITQMSFQSFLNNAIRRSQERSQEKSHEQEGSGGSHGSEGTGAPDTDT